MVLDYGDIKSTEAVRHELSSPYGIAVNVEWRMGADSFTHPCRRDCGFLSFYVILWHSVNMWIHT